MLLLDLLVANNSKRLSRVRVHKPGLAPGPALAEPAARRAQCRQPRLPVRARGELLERILADVAAVPVAAPARLLPLLDGAQRQARLVDGLPDLLLRLGAEPLGERGRASGAVVYVVAGDPGGALGGAQAAGAGLLELGGEGVALGEDLGGPLVDGARWWWCLYWRRTC